MGMSTPTGTDVILRRVTRDDRLRIRHLFLAIHEEYNLEVDFDGRDNDLLHLPEGYTRQREGFWVLEETSASGSTLIGTVAISRINLREAMLKRFYVHKAYRSKGYGKKLMDIATDAAREFRYTRLLLTSHTTQEAAINFYRRYGYQEIPVFGDDPIEYTNIAFGLNL